MTRLGRSFYARPTLDVLDAIIGKVLVHRSPAGTAAGIIVEAEAYIGEDDPACHAAPGPTRRNAPLYGAPGHAYVYLNYGIHNLVNAVTESIGRPAAILIRALEPVEGLALMQTRRQAGTGRGRGTTGTTERTLDASAICRGPGNLTVALGVTLADNGRDLTRGALYLEDRGIRCGERAYSPRIGIRVGTDRLWRCSWAGHPAVSGPRGISVAAAQTAGGPRRSRSLTSPARLP